MKNTDKFDVLINNSKKIPITSVKNIADIIFNQLPHRNENSIVIVGHSKKKLISISLTRLRYITAILMSEFKKQGLKPSDTVLLTTISINNEFFISLIFIALAAYGIRVLFPVFVETNDLKIWLQQTNCKAIIIPKLEINSMSNSYKKEKEIVHRIIGIAEDNQIKIFDTKKHFYIETYFNDSISANFFKEKNEIINYAIKKTDFTTESVMVTTSGTSGRSKLLCYEQGAFIRNCLCWQASNMYKPNKMGGRNFIDILPHTISIRTLFNALWAGFPLCIITSDWLKNSPQKVLPLIIKMKPEVVTLGPSTINIITDFLEIFPELKKQIFPNLHTVVSTGTTYSKKTSQFLRNNFGIYLHNAYGTSETQQVLTTVIMDEEKIKKFDTPPLGEPIAGVSIGLKKTDIDLYKLYVKSPFGHNYAFDPETQSTIYPKTYFDTGDLVKIDKNNNLFYVGRENRDFINNGFGVKVPIFYLKQYYKLLYECGEVNHIEYFPAEVSTITLGIAALIFIKNKCLPEGIVTNKKITKAYLKLLKKINSQLLKTIEPFEYEHRRITRFLLVNATVPITIKKTISKYKIEKMFKNEIALLKKSKDSKSGIKNVFSLKFYFLKIVMANRFFRNKILRKIVLKLFLWGNKS